ncbi:MAG: hypothetical protein K5891_07950 [Lachnospiraceae bacterium]|nr:hypothetical protein [Lachnospiraceae bacterium]
MKKLCECVDKGIQGSITVLFASVAAFLVLGSGFVTAMVSYDEGVGLLPDSMAGNLLGSVLFAAFLLFLGRLPQVRSFLTRVDTDAAFSNSLRRGILLALAAAGALFLLILQKEPVADQYWVVHIADAFAEKDYSALMPGGYADTYPNQLGIILVFYFLGKLVGTNNYLLFQLCNVVALVFLYRAFVLFCDRAGRKPHVGLLVLMAAVFFTPGFFYLTFTYGNLIGLSLVMNALLLLDAFAEKKRWCDLVLALVCCYFAVVLKSNYLVFLIGLLVYLVLLLLRHKDLLLLLAMAGIVLVMLLEDPIARGVTRAVTGVTVSEGSSMWSFVAMGMMENPHRFNGWHNGYDIESYHGNAFDVEAQTAENQAKVRELLGNFGRNRAYTIWFFGGKNLSAWTNPDFQGYWLNRAESATVNEPAYLRRLFTLPKASEPLLNAYTFLIYLGALLYALLERRKSAIGYGLMITVFGGFLFHTVWEIKAQYMLFYFLLLIPLFVVGWGRVTQTLEMALKMRGRSEAAGRRGVRDGETAGEMSLHGKEDGKNFRILVISCCVLLLLTLLVYLQLIPSLNNLVAQRDTAYYEQQLEIYPSDRIPDGAYSVRTLSGSALYLDADTDLVRAGESDTQVTLRTSRTDDTLYVRFFDVAEGSLPDGLLMELTDASATPGAAITAGPASDVATQRWNFKRGDAPEGVGSDGAVYGYLRFGPYKALAYDPATGAVTLEWWNLQDANQLWCFEAR